MEPIERSVRRLVGREFKLKSSSELEAIDRQDRRDVLRDRLGSCPWKLCGWSSHPELIKASAAWMRGDPNLILTGPTGAGKSVAAMLLLRKLARIGVSRGGSEFEFAKRMRWQPAKELCAVRIDDRFGAEEPEEVWKSKRCSLLVLNDLGKQKAANGLWNVLEYRYEREHPTIVTSVESETEMVARYGDEMARRLFETGNRKAKIVEVK